MHPPTPPFSAVDIFFVLLQSSRDGGEISKAKLQAGDLEIFIIFISRKLAGRRVTVLQFPW